MIDTSQRVRAARQDAAVFDRPERAWCEVRGDDRVRFLHAMLSNAVEGVGEGSGNRAVLLTDKGKLVADLHVLVGADRILLGPPRERRDAVLETLDRYVIADDVELSPLDLRTVSLVGPRAAELARALFGAAPEAPYDHLAVAWAGADAIAARLPWCGLPSVEVLVAPEQVEPLLEAAAARGAVVGHGGDAEILRVEAGEPRWGHELGEDVLPLEARLGQTLHRTKGCYVGQETVVRVLSRGHVNWLVTGLRLGDAAVPARGEAVADADGREVGRITSAVRSPTEGTLALARLRREVAEPGRRLGVGGAEAVVAALPFV